LYQMLKIFTTIENNFIIPYDLQRKHNIIYDINELSDYDNFSYIILEPTKKYAHHLLLFNDDTIWPHIYLNYMAFIFGGQMIKKNIMGSGLVYEFNNISTLIETIRSKQSDEWADEVNKGYDFLIDIYEELQRNFE
jgi:hypothetical protein